MVIESGFEQVVKASFIHPVIAHLFIYLLLLFFWSRQAAGGILVPRPGIEPAPPAVEAQSLNHWTTREVQLHIYLLDAH